MIARSMQRNGLILALFGVIATLLVMATATVTKDPIAQQQQRQLLRVLNELIPPSAHDNDLYASCTLLQQPELGGQQQRLYRATLAGQPQAVAVEVVAPNGYSGAIRLLVAISADGRIAGVRTLEHAETPGLGDKIERRKSDWITAFAGKQVNGNDDTRWAVKRDGGMFDQFTGATITPRAVIQAIKRTGLSYQAHAEDWFNRPANCQSEAL